MRHLWKMDKRITILYEDNHLLVVEKPSNIPVMEDDSKDEDLLTLLKQDLKVRYNKPGEVYLGLVHRLDRPTGGVMVFAKTSKAASRISEYIRNKDMKKKYSAQAFYTWHNKLTGSCDGGSVTCQHHFAYAVCQFFIALNCKERLFHNNSPN